MTEPSTTDPYTTGSTAAAIAAPRPAAPLTYELWVADEPGDGLLVVRRVEHRPHLFDVWRVTPPDGARFAADMQAWNRDDTPSAAVPSGLEPVAAGADQADEPLACAAFVAIWEPGWTTAAPAGDPAEPIPAAATSYLGCFGWAAEPAPPRWSAPAAPTR